MPRNKKTTESIESSEEIVETKINEVHIDFNREDLNQLCDKINEIINYINNA